MAVAAREPALAAGSRRSTISGSTNERVLRPKHTAAPSGTSSSAPAAAGPTTRARLNPAELSETAVCSDSGGTSVETVASWAGYCIACAIPPAPDSTISTAALPWPVSATTVSAPAVTS